MAVPPKQRLPQGGLAYRCRPPKPGPSRWRYTPWVRSGFCGAVVARQVGGVASLGLAVEPGDVGLDEQGGPRRRVFRRLPTHNVDVNALDTPCPIASLMERCNACRSRL